MARCRENEQNVERVKIEGSRQVNHYKQKYTEYKNKMRKANQNIAVLMARLAKFDLEAGTDRPPRHEQAYVAGQDHLPAHLGHSPPAWAGDQLQDLLSNDGLNEEIRKLLSENI